MILFGIVGPIFAQNKEDIVQRAQNLLLQGDRSSAIKMLVREQEREKNSYNLKAVINKVSKNFISDKALQNYELAIVLRHSNRSRARKLLDEALYTDKDNFLVQAEIYRIQILGDQCTQAEEGAMNNLKLNPYSDLMKLIKAQAQLCQKKTESIILPISTEKIDMKAPYRAEWINIELEKSAIEKIDSHQSLNRLQELESINPDNPEILYWKFQLESDKEKKRQWAEAYYKFCDSLSTAQQRTLINEVFLCQRIKKVRSYLDALNEM